MTRALRFVWRHVRRALVFSCQVLAASSPGADSIMALTAITARRRTAIPPAPGRIPCGCAARGCDLAPHWMFGVAVIGAARPGGHAGITCSRS